MEGSAQRGTGLMKSRNGLILKGTSRAKRGTDGAKSLVGSEEYTGFFV